MHYYQFNIGDYKSHTDHLTNIEDLGYRRLLDWLYLHEKPLPSDPQKVARLIRMSENEAEIHAVLAEFFTLTDDGWVQERVNEEIAEFKAKQDRARANGKKGGRPVKPKKTSLVSTANQEESGLKTKHKPLTINQEPLTINQGKDIRAKTAARFSPPTLAQVIEYCNERANNVDANKFIDFYSSKGWMVGKNKMKDWKAAVRNWERSSDQKSTGVKVSNTEFF